MDIQTKLFDFVEIRIMINKEKKDEEDKKNVAWFDAL
jgi:hypothetical protein